ncbi:MAG: SURF1 family protein [Alsobacter sp.]
MSAGSGPGAPARHDKAPLLPGAGSRPVSRLAPAAIATAVIFAILVGLGFWQVERMGSKQRLLARIEHGLASPPAPLPPESDWPRLAAKTYDYAKVTLTGTFLHEKEFHLQGLMTGEGSRTAPPATLLGYYVLTPAQLADGSLVIVNRGFVPPEKLDPASRAEGQVQGPQTIVGLMRAPQGQGWFTPDDQPAKNLWFTRDPAKMAASAGLQRVAPFAVDADATPVPGGLPAGGKTIISFPNNHLQYAITWFALAIALLAVFFAWARQQVKTPRGP